MPKKENNILKAEKETIETTHLNNKIPLWVHVICYAIIIAAAFHSSTMIAGGNDTWIAMASGRHYITNKAAVSEEHRSIQMKFLDLFGIHLSRNDPFSPYSRTYNPDSKDQEGWINQNWLSHIIFYQLYKNLGGISIIIYKFIICILTVLFMYQAIRISGIHPLIAALTVGCGILLSRSYIDLRPNTATIMFTAAMLLIVSHWKQGRLKAIFWLFPVMMLWSNIHGGFIFAILAFIILVFGHIAMLLLNKPFNGKFDTVSISQLKYLIIGFFIVSIIPVLFSPYGLDNLLHPLLVITGENGEVWRDIREWRSIFNELHFGNAEPYKIYLIFLILIGIAHIIYMLFLKRRKSSSKRNSPAATLPKYDAAYLGVFVVTVLMACRSSRFVYLSSIVSSLFLALVIHQLIILWLNKHWKKETDAKSAKKLVHKILNFYGALFGAGGLIILIFFFSNTVLTDYYENGTVREESLFYRMSIFSSQCPQAMSFITHNNITGVVLGEWVNGGYISYAQQPKNGKPPLQVFIDGRAQAAYKAEHYLLYNYILYYIKALPKRKKDAITAYKAGTQTEKQKHAFEQQIHAINKEIKEFIPKLSRYGITAVLLLSIPEVVDAFTQTNHWMPVYADDKNLLLLNRLVPSNRRIIEKSIDELWFPNTFSKDNTYHMIQYFRELRNRIPGF